MAQDRTSMRQGSVTIGYFNAQTQPKHQAAVLDLFDMAPGLDRDFWHIPPIDTLFLHRKRGGLYLLAARLKARVNVQTLARDALAALG